MLRVPGIDIRSDLHVAQPSWVGALKSNFGELFLQDNTTKQPETSVADASH